MSCAVGAQGIVVNSARTSSDSIQNVVDVPILGTTVLLRKIRCQRALHRNAGAQDIENFADSYSPATPVFAKRLLPIRETAASSCGGHDGVSSRIGSHMHEQPPPQSPPAARR